MAKAGLGLTVCYEYTVCYTLKFKRLPVFVWFHEKQEGLSDMLLPTVHWLYGQGSTLVIRFSIAGNLLERLKFSEQYTSLLLLLLCICSFSLSACFI